MNNLTNILANKQNERIKIAQSSSKSRLRRDPVLAFRDIEESPIKPYPVKSERCRGITKEDEAELEHTINITKSAKEPKEDDEDEPIKPMRKIKTNNKIYKYQDLSLCQRSPSKVAVRLRVPLQDRNYSFRNRDLLKTRDIL